jgi:competence protein ComEC
MTVAKQWSASLIESSFRRARRAIVLASWALCLAWLPLAVHASEVVPSERVKRNVIVRLEASTQSPAIDRLSPGESAVFVADLPGWYQVRLTDGRTGYISKTWSTLIGGGDTLTASGGPYLIHIIDIGTGLAVFVEGRDFTMLYDSGSQDDLATGGDNRVIAYIKAVRPNTQTIDHLVLSHPHKDHLELLPDIFDRFSIRHVWDSGRVNKTRGYCRFLKKVESEQGVQYHNAIATGGTYSATFTGSGCKGTITIPQAVQMSAAPISLGNGAQMALLYRDASPHADPNGNSVVVRLDLGSKRILLMGDAEGGDRQLPSAPPKNDSIEAMLLDCCRVDIKADAMIVGHHGSLTSSRSAFLDGVSAKIFVISSGPHPYSSVVLPDEEIVSELQRRGEVFRTDIEDADCASAAAKIGPDADESPGGCNNVLVIVGTDGEIAARYNNIFD